MQIHELTRRPLAEVDIAGPRGLLSTITTAGKALWDKPGAITSLAKSQQTAGANWWDKTKAAVGSNPLASTSALNTTEFAQRMQAIKNAAATKEVATQLQKQWNQYSKNLAPAPATDADTAPTTSESTQIKSVKDKTKRGQSLQLQEAASLEQLTDWYTKSVIPQSLSSHESEYLQQSDIKKALNDILASQNNPGQQNQAFINLVSATSVKSQEISAKNPSTRRGGLGSPAVSRTLSGGADVAKQNIMKAAGIATSGYEALVKITSELGEVRSADETTKNYLKALGFNVA